LVTAGLPSQGLKKTGVLTVVTKWDYRLAENYRQSDETKAQSMLRWIKVHGKEGWEFDRIVDFGEGDNCQLLFRRQISN
jgi:hypothetical protein